MTKPEKVCGWLSTEDERFLIISAANSTTGNELYVQDLKNPAAKLITAVNNFDNDHNIIGNEGDRLIIQTNLKAPNSKVVEVNFSKPTPENWKEIIPETETYSMQEPWQQNLRQLPR